MSDRVLDGKVIVITGAGQGLGRAYAEAATAAGATLLVNDINEVSANETVSILQAAGGTAAAHVADVTDWDASRGIVERCVREFGRIDGLVNNAGTVRPQLMVDETEEIIRRTIDINVYGTMFITVHAARKMVEQGSGAIVNIASGNQCGTPLFAAYGASKSAVASLTYSWAMELEEHGVRVNAISPSAHTAQHDLIEEIVGFNPEARKWPSKEDNASVVVFLLSDLSEKLNGQVVRVDYRHMSVCGHPVIVYPRAVVEDFSVEQVAQEFDELLNDHLQPLGIVGAEIEHRGALVFE
jgi:NAD(P)-dependent dehydrogenase (short-subunit alcohol dehydrogenase family)